jgi:hypothetical protein
LNNPPPQVPPGLQPKIDRLLSWGKWSCLVLDVAGILICAGTRRSPMAEDAPAARAGSGPQVGVEWR